MFKKTSIAVFIALFIVIAVSGLYYDRNKYRTAHGNPRGGFDGYVDRFVNDSVLAGETFISGISTAMTSIEDIFGIARKIPIIKDLVYVKEETDWSSVQVYELDYRRSENRNKTDFDVLPPEEYVKKGDQLIVRTICAAYDIWHPHVFYRVWFYDENGYWTDLKCYSKLTYKREILGVIGKPVRKVIRGMYLGRMRLGYCEKFEEDYIIG